MPRAGRRLLRGARPYLRRPGRVLDRDPIRERTDFGSIAISLGTLQLKTVKEQELNCGLPRVWVGEADRSALGLIRVSTLRREALQRKGGTPLSRREGGAIDDQANPLESGRGLIQGFRVGDKVGVHGLLPAGLLVMARSWLLGEAGPGSRLPSSQRGVCQACYSPPRAGTQPV